MELLEYWKKALGLSNWFIRLVEVNREQMVNAGSDDADSETLGLCDQQTFHRTATIYINTEILETFDEDDPLFQAKHIDYEHVIVHELLHLKFPTRFAVAANEWITLERSINDVADALVSLKKAGTP